MTEAALQIPARWIAEHILWTFALLLVTALVFAAFAWRAIQRFRRPLWRRAHRLWLRVNASAPARAAAARVPPLRALAGPSAFAARHLVLDLIAGFVLIWLAVIGFVALADEIGLGEELHGFDMALSQALSHTVTDTARQWMAWITRLADARTQTWICIAGAVLLLAWRQRALAAIWVAAIAGNGILNRTLKAYFQRERPLHDHGWVSELGWSFPSGHSSGSVAVYGMTAYLLLRVLPARWHLPLVLGALALILTIGFSRVLLQVHYASDVAAGFLSGSAWLLVCIATAEVIRGRTVADATARR